MINWVVERQKEARKLVPPTYGFTNVVACAPLRYTIEGGSIRSPDMEDIFNCFPRLQSTIKLATPKAIICVGAVAKETIKKKAYPAINIHHMVHPAYLLRIGLNTAAFKRARLIIQDVFEEQGS